MITGTIETNLAAFNSSLTRYMIESGKSADEVLAKKGRDLEIEIFRGFRERKWGGAGKRKGIARAELKARTAQGKGTKVRASLLAAYLRERASMNFFARSIGQQLRRFRSQEQNDSLLASRQANRRQRAGLWRKVVGKEIGLRQSGIGVLGASFLWHRSRSAKARGTFVTKNRLGKPLGSVIFSDGKLRIQGFTEGLGRVSARYGVVNRAISEVMADTEIYLSRNQSALARRIFERSIGRALFA